MLDVIARDMAAATREIVKSAVDDVSKKYDEHVKILQEEIISLKKAISELPQAEKGEPGKNGEDGKPGKDGKDGVSPSADEVAKSMEGIFSKWALEFERKADLVLEKAIDRMPKPKDGKNGKNALELKDFDIALCEDGRTISVTMDNGEEKIEKSVKLAVILDKGVFKYENTYEKGDGVTFGGKFWICQKDTPEGSPGSSDDWRLAVNKGRDAKSQVQVKPDIKQVSLNGNAG